MFTPAEQGYCSPGHIMSVKLNLILGAVFSLESEMREENETPYSNSCLCL